MAVFTSTQELEQQKQHRNFVKGKGNLLFKGTGEKTGFGKVIGNVPLLGTATNLIGQAAATGDQKEVIKSQLKDEIGADVAAAKFAGSTFMAFGGANALGIGMKGAGAGGGATKAGAIGSKLLGGSAETSSQVAAEMGGGVFSKAGTKGLGKFGGATKAGAFISKLGGGASQTALQAGGAGSVSMFKEGSKVADLAASKGGKALTNQLQSSGKQAVMDSINKDSEEMTDEEVKALSEENYTTQAEAQAGNAEVGTTGESGATEAMGKAADLTSMIPVLGEGLGVVAQKMAIANNYKNKRKEIAGQTLTGNDSRRV
jgi:hypothetical protein